MEVYKITNKVNGKSYVGSTTYTKEDRWKGHIRCSKSDDPRPLYKDMRTYGLGSFELETVHSIVSDITISELQRLEYQVIQSVPEHLRYNINISDSMESARAYYLKEGHKIFKKERKGIYSESSYAKDVNRKSIFTRTKERTTQV